MVTMNSHGVESSIAGGVEGMVCGPNPRSFFFIFILFEYHVLCCYIN